MYCSLCTKKKKKSRVLLCQYLSIIQKINLVYCYASIYRFKNQTHLCSKKNQTRL